MKTCRCLVLIGLSYLLTGCTQPPAKGAEKKLIEFGWDSPSTAYLKDHIAEMEKMPFDGLVLYADYKNSQGKPVHFYSTDFGIIKIPWSALQPALHDLKATHFHRFTDNFLRFDATPADVDWFDDFSPILHNAAVAAQLAKEGGLKGILFDEETYAFPIFDYSKLKYHQSYTFDEYAAQVKKRGEEIMKAFQSKYPGLTLFLTFSYYFSGRDRASLPSSHYGLLAPFLDGLFAAAKGKTIIVDGFEGAYAYTTPADFEYGYQMQKTKRSPLCSVPGAYRHHLSIGFGIWMDLNEQTKGWHIHDLSRNPRTPTELTQALTMALKKCDRYVWLYCQKPHWWPRKDLPDAYITAIEKARQVVGMPNP
ncbi:MAG: hypothetical protein M1330_04850 [Armatimonadetes bacterium]|nr:hypothetical protein [Armatimonadota bacterium]